MLKLRLCHFSFFIKDCPPWCLSPPTGQSVHCPSPCICSNTCSLWSNKIQLQHKPGNISLSVGASLSLSLSLAPSPSNVLLIRCRSVYV